MLVKIIMHIPQTQAEYLYGLASSQKLFTMQVIDSWRVSIYNKICKCMHDMYEILLIMNMQQSYADDLERQNEWLRQQLEGLGIDPYSGAGTSIAGPSDAYYSEPSREWSPWPDPY